jgi:aminoglycoside/choline kinase family phosphotransferase
MTQAVSQLYKKWSGHEPDSIDLLPESGSDRRYFRLHGQGKSVIGTYGENIRENEAFLYFTEHFNKKGLPVPQFLAVAEDKRAYLQSDLGDTSLLSVLEKEGETPTVYALFQQTVQSLARLQVKADAGLDYSRCLTNQEFGKQAILADLLYFKYYFLDALRKPYDKQKLIDDFDALSNYLTHTEYKYFLFRDFQSRNVLVHDQKVWFIDYQGGMKGAPQYDLASLLWQAKANLSAEWKEKLLTDYLDKNEAVIQERYWEDKYKEDGWLILSVKRAGSLGGNFKIRDQDIKDFLDLCYSKGMTLTQMRHKFPNQVNIVYARNLHLPPHNYLEKFETSRSKQYTDQSAFDAAMKYKSNGDIYEKDRKLYAVLGKRKLLQKVRDAFSKRNKKK